MSKTYVRHNIEPGLPIRCEQCKSCFILVTPKNTAPTKFTTGYTEGSIYSEGDRLYLEPYAIEPNAKIINCTETISLSDFPDF